MIPFSKPNDHRLAVPGYLLAAIVAGAVLIAGSAMAQRPATSEETMVISSASSNVDDAANTADFKDISVTQGTRRLTAERARASGLGAKNSQWTFVGHVVISLDPNSWILADQAILEYRDGKLTQVRATGSPTYFDQIRSEPQPRRHGQADVITYDAKQDTVNLQGHAQLSDGDSMEISAPIVVYSIRDHTWQADSATKARTVQIKVRP
jgi:lipopolysaccharide transport protein LptA